MLKCFYMKIRNIFLWVLIVFVSCCAANAKEAVKYIDAVWDGERVVFTEKEITEYNIASSGTWTGWYVVKPGTNVAVTTRITVSGTANLILCDGATFSAKDGIEVSDMNTLNIYAQSKGTGKLNARSNYFDYSSDNYDAAIGGSRYQPCGTVIINGGNVTAVPAIGSYGGAGIGGGQYGGGGTITINAGTVNATGGTYHGSNYYGGAGIGGGHYGAGGGITINGGTVYATNGYYGAGIGGGYYGAGGNITINGGNVTTINNSEGYVGSGIGAGWGGNGITNITINDGIVNSIGGIKGCSGKRSIITINGGTVTATIDGGSTDGSDITINGGTVKAVGSRGKAGIDGGYYGVGSIITINSGDITAKGDSGSAGINGGNAGYSVKITGGMVNATGGYGKAGIDCSKSKNGTGDIVEIIGGNVTATGGNGGAGIGGGQNETGGTVRISGGNVTVTGGYEASGIGGGKNGAGASVEITGGAVITIGGNYGGPGIGAGLNIDDNGTLTLSSNVRLSGGMNPNPTELISKVNGDYSRYRYMNTEVVILPDIKIDNASTMPKSGTVNKKFTGTLTASGGTSYRWKKKSGTLPPGLKLSSTTKDKVILSGTPTEAGKFTFTLKVTDESGATASEKFTIKIAEKPIVSGDLTAKGVIKKPYSSSVKVSGGTSPYVWTKSGTLPKGLELVSSSTGSKLTLKGTPTTAKEYTFTLKATDKNGAIASKKFTVTVTKPTISGTLTASGNVKKSYSSSLTVSGGTSPYTWTKSGTIPAGLKLTYNTKGTKVTLKGTPTTAKTYNFTLKVTDKNGATASQKVTVTIAKAATTSKLKSTETEQNEKTSGFENVQDVTSDAEADNFSDSYELTELNVLSDDVLWQGTGKDEDLVGVKANEPVTFVIGEWVNRDGTAAEVSDIKIFVDDEVVDDVNVSDLGTFTIQSEFINGDFKIQVKAKTKTSELETQELFVSVEE